MGLKLYPPNKEEGKMPDKILIFGKDAWPYTRAARAAYAKEGRQVEYFNVVEVVGYLETMLKHSNGARKVPVIVMKGIPEGYDFSGWKPNIKKIEDFRLKIEDLRSAFSGSILNGLLEN